MSFNEQRDKTVQNAKPVAEPLPRRDGGRGMDQGGESQRARKRTNDARMHVYTHTHTHTQRERG